MAKREVVIMQESLVLDLGNGQKVQVSVTASLVPSVEAVQDGLGTPVFQGINYVSSASGGRRVDAVDPVDGRNEFPAGRGVNELILYTSKYGKSINVNPYGYSVSLNGRGVVLSPPTSLPMNQPQGNSMVLSGHTNASGIDSASSFVSALQVGDKLMFSSMSVTPTSDKPAAAFGKRVLGEYVMDGVGHVSDLSEACNRLLVAFYQGSGLVEWSGRSWSEIGKEFTQWRDAVPGRQIVVSLGGAGGQVDLSSVPEGISRINRDFFPVDGIDFDIEAFEVESQYVVDVCVATAKALGRDPGQLVVQFVPPGGPPVARALTAAVECQKLGFDVTFGQQLYETAITDDQVYEALALAVGALDASSVLVGIMLHDDYGSWDHASALRRVSEAVRRWDALGGVYVWESSREGTRRACDALGEILR